MKYTVFSVAATIALMAASPPAPAQEEEESMVSPSVVSYGIAAGATVPTGSLSDLHSTGWNVEGSVDWVSRSIPVGFRGELGYHRLLGEQLTLNSPGGPISVSAGDLSLWVATADLLFLLRPGSTRAAVTPYALGGVGLYHASGEQTGTAGGTTEASVDNSTTNVGINFGAGVVWRISSFSTFAELRFHNVFRGAIDDNGDKTAARFFPLSLGLRFGRP